MTRSELFACTAWTLASAAVLVPLALVAGSGHASISGVFGASVALVASLVLLPALLAWQMIEGVAGSVLGAIAAASAELACIFCLVYFVRRLKRRKADFPNAGLLRLAAPAFARG